LAGGFLYTWKGAIADIPWSVLQVVGSAVFYFILAAVLDGIHLKRRINLR
jgi:hypothetical protein